MSKMKTSKEVIQQAKERFKELEHKNFDWRSFYNGYLEAFAETIPPPPRNLPKYHNPPPPPPRDRLIKEGAIPPKPKQRR